MQEIVENRMVVNSEWEVLENPIMEDIAEKLNSAGYTEMGTGIFVPEEGAYEYALERISLDEELKKEFVEWFYSWDWIKED